MTNSLLIKSIPYEEFDYQTLLDSIHGYALEDSKTQRGTGHERATRRRNHSVSAR